LSEGLAMKQQDRRHADVERAFAEAWPRIIRGNVRLIDEYPNAKRCYVRLDGALLTAILEAECIDEELWLHLSVAGQKPARIPTWEELLWCKEHFLGDRKAIQVLPPRAEYINMDARVLHLYAPLESDPLPDFRMLSGDGTPQI
jgi:hypothetical protein